ncbi:MAG: thioredoxin family protein [SAR324 cluster bacterium]|nr:thioredoxin family protein [SAR324 cluster bacterium]
MATEIIELSDADYTEKMTAKNGFVLFYKKICPHCKALKKVIDKLSTSIPDIDVMYIDSEENPVAMEAIQVSKVPTLLIVKKGKVVAKKAGLMNVREMTAFYEQSD